MASHVPVIIGVGEFKNASRRMEDALETLDLMVRAIKEAADDAAGGQSAGILGQVDAVSVVASSTWPYTDLPGLVAGKLGIKPSHSAYSELAGSSPVELVDDTARLVAQGSIKLGVVVGGEAKASRTKLHDDILPEPLY